MGMPLLPAVQRASERAARAGGQASKSGIMVFVAVASSSIWCQRPLPTTAVLQGSLPKLESAHSPHSADLFHSDTINLNVPILLHLTASFRLHPPIESLFELVLWIVILLDGPHESKRL